jgi:hypothetical protein
MTFGELVTLWLAAIISRVKKSTYANYKAKIDTHIVPILGDVRYDFLTSERLNRFIADKLKSGESRTAARCRNGMFATSPF